jgi:hypothetical protein
MKNRYRIYVRGKHSIGKVWMIQDNQTGKRESLKTKDKNKALGILLLPERKEWRPVWRWLPFEGG